MSNKHTPEPWARGTHSADNGEPFDVIFGADGGVVVGDDELTPPNARRIVACVNACRGLPTDELEQKGLVAAVGYELLKMDTLVNQMLSALEVISSVADQERGNAIEMKEIADAAIASARGDAC